jgi:hypothetical protein
MVTGDAGILGRLKVCHHMVTEARDRELLTVTIGDKTSPPARRICHHW